ncbi:hypothetical protein EA658_19735 [Pseudoxanthomonas winnipegensis]|jgi:hypothetical protein|uniref:Uncharacterized protein n=1 Tax=Pseudoxanthomonas winnipegensis TaxID=2480810 RepID=A0ABY1W9N4_9GAMM|nr:hypothetical protein [Pseudoxanthomonas winnipegensis]TAA06979.1 hypothetical protein EA659_19130 [Pseudoxanthomonas winnipegensis]TAA16892.1 hypothetical protein EA658_19735 [Pseudoxanthomonas winnipegensis]TAH73480.1 hypothetical protein EA657_07355 [Pseudoxanthomonas winnipegensis]
MKRWMLLLALCCGGAADATSIVHLPLSEILAKSDHVIVGRVVEVDMIDGQGRPVTDFEAPTRPGLSNVIRYRVHVEDVLQTNAARVPAVLVIPEWSAWHNTLGHAKASATGERFVFLLSGADFHPTNAAQFRYRLDSQEWKDLSPSP